LLLSILTDFFTARWSRKTWHVRIWNTFVKRHIRSQLLLCWNTRRV